jgi:selenide,water dikinase
MGGDPILAIAILGWPINILPPSIAKLVIEGGKSICIEAGIPLAGGHSIDSPEPIFGLAVNGIIDVENLKKNNSAKEGDVLLLTKKIGVGILTTAEKKNILREDEKYLAAEQMMKLNKVGSSLGKIKEVNAMTDVTGFGLLGHLIEMAEGSNLTAEINHKFVHLISENIIEYIEKGSIPGGTKRNLESYRHKVNYQNKKIEEIYENILADPQTSGGLLIAVSEKGLSKVIDVLNNYGLGNFIKPIGGMKRKSIYSIEVI